MDAEDISKHIKHQGIKEGDLVEVVLNKGAIVDFKTTYYIITHQGGGKDCEGQSTKKLSGYIKINGDEALDEAFGLFTEWDDKINGPSEGAKMCAYIHSSAIYLCVKR